MDEGFLESPFNGFVVVDYINENIEEFLINVSIKEFLTTLCIVRYLIIASTMESLTILKTKGFLTIANTKEFLTISSTTAHPITKNIKALLTFVDEEVYHNLEIIWEFVIKFNQKILVLSHTIIEYQYQTILHNF
jgi:hypothetical protein